MTTRKESFVSGEYYHIYNRGNSKQKIFLNNQDKDRFARLLYLCNSTKNINFRDDIVKKKIDVWDFNRSDSLVSIGAWVLMPNHFHLYISPSPRVPLGQEGDKMVSLFMGKLMTAYSMYFNKKHGRTGTLFEGPFKSVHIENDEQAKYLFSYIHLNPIKLIDPKWKESGIKNIKKSIKFLDNYKWSSFVDIKGIERPESKILSIADFPKYFRDKKAFEEEIFEWINFNNSNQP